MRKRGCDAGGSERKQLDQGLAKLREMNTAHGCRFVFFFLVLVRPSQLHAIHPRSQQNSGRKIEWLEERRD